MWKLSVEVLELKPSSNLLELELWSESKSILEFLVDDENKEIPAQVHFVTDIVPDYLSRGYLKGRKMYQLNCLFKGINTIKSFWYLK